MNAIAIPKPRPDAKLKNLSEDRQAEIAEFARVHSLAERVHWLGRNNLHTSISAVSKFLRLCRFREQLAQDQAALHAAIVDSLRHDPAAFAGFLNELGELVFGANALEQQDPRAWYFVQQTALRRAELQLRAGKLSSLQTPLVPPCPVLHPAAPAEPPANPAQEGLGGPASLDR